MMQHRLAKRPYPFSLFAGASCLGAVGINLLALKDFGQVMITPTVTCISYVCAPSISLLKHFRQVLITLSVKLIP